MTRKHRLLSLLAASAAALSLFPGSTYAADFRPSSGDPVLRWNDAMLQAISRSGIGPTPTSRALGIVGTSMYDAWAAYDQVAIGTTQGSRLQVSDEHNTQQNKEEAVSYAAYRALVDLFPEQKQLFGQLMIDLGYDSSVTGTDLETAAGVGNYVSQRLLSDRYNDGSNQINGYAAMGDYQPSNTWDYVTHPQLWQPISLNNGVTVQQFLTPHWGDVTPFALSSGDQFLPPPPKPFLNSDGGINPDYISQTLEVLEYSAELTDREKVLAEYWADGPATVLPPGHWNLFGQYVSTRDQLSFDDNVKLFFALGNAELDAGIAAWDAKVTYDYVRPITAIQYLAEKNLLPEEHDYVRRNAQGQTEIYAWGGPDQGSQWILGSDWLPYQDISFVTPPFGEYVSGHSTFSAAGAEILQRFTGSDALGLCHTELANSSTFEQNTPNEPIQLCWNTFTAAADEAGVSRLYGGIHFTDGDVNGRKLGRQVGASVWERSQFYINGGDVEGSLSGDRQTVPEPSLLLGLLLGSLGVGRLKCPSNLTNSSNFSLF